MNNNIQSADNVAENVNDAYQAAVENYTRLKAECEQAEYEMHTAYKKTGDYKSAIPNNWNNYVEFEEKEALLRGETI